jgi:hypothetical protein
VLLRIIYNDLRQHFKAISKYLRDLEPNSESPIEMAPWTADTTPEEIAVEIADQLEYQLADLAVQVTEIQSDRALEIGTRDVVNTLPLRITRATLSEFYPAVFLVGLGASSALEILYGSFILRMTGLCITIVCSLGYLDPQGFRLRATEITRRLWNGARPVDDAET